MSTLKLIIIPTLIIQNSITAAIDNEDGKLHTTVANFT